MRPLPLLLALALTACVPGFPPARPAPRPVFDPIAFFSGQTRGEGRLSIVFRSPSRFAVDGSGRIAPDGSVILDQRIHRLGRTPQRRQWRIARIGPGRYAASLSSADGPVSAAVDGNLLRLDFREKGLAVHQEIVLDADGRSARNRMTLSKLGIPIAAVEETILRLEPAR